MTACLLLEYDGADFAGWARQPGLRTVEETVEHAIATVRGEPAELTVAGRTDAGVHARGQVASHAGDAAGTDSLNGVLPADVRVLASEPVADGFDARRDALSRTYRYRLHVRRQPSPFERGRALHWRQPLDMTALRECGAATLGTHDFTAFTPTQTDHVRFDRDVHRSEWLEEPDHVLAYWIEADTFMRHMVRTLVGTMLAVASDRMGLARYRELLTGLPRAQAGDTVAAHGLYLESVRY